MRIVNKDGETIMGFTEDGRVIFYDEDMGDAKEFFQDLKYIVDNRRLNKNAQ